MIIWFLADENRAPKMNVGARQAGINRAETRKHPSSRTDGNNRGKPAKFRVACPECPFEGGYPLYTTVQYTDRKAICKNSHHIDCSGGCKVAA